MGGPLDEAPAGLGAGDGGLSPEGAGQPQGPMSGNDSALPPPPGTDSSPPEMGADTGSPLPGEDASTTDEPDAAPPTNDDAGIPPPDAPSGLPETGGPPPDAAPSICAGPGTAAGCHACSSSSPTCQPNGCYNGYLCDTQTNRCHSPSSCP
jgi:hypothetical protein